MQTEKGTGKKSKLSIKFDGVNTYVATYEDTDKKSTYIFVGIFS